MVQRINHATSAQEEQSLEEGMREEVEHARTGCILRTTNAKAHKHIPKLADGRERQHALEVGLYQSNSGSEEGSNRANPGHNRKSCGIGCCEEREGTRNHVDTGSDHRGSVDQSA